MKKSHSLELLAYLKNRLNKAEHAMNDALFNKEDIDSFMRWRGYRDAICDIMEELSK